MPTKHRFYIGYNHLETRCLQCEERYSGKTEWGADSNPWKCADTICKKHYRPAIHQFLFCQLLLHFRKCRNPICVKRELSKIIFTVEISQNEVFVGIVVKRMVDACIPKNL